MGQPITWRGTNKIGLQSGWCLQAPFTMGRPANWQGAINVGY